MKPIAKLMLLLCLINHQLFAQTIDKQAIESTVTKIASFIKEKYVFERKGESISHLLLKELEQGKFSKNKDWQSLATNLTTTLQSISNDGHMYVRNEPKTVQELIEAEKSPKKDTQNQTTYDPFFYGEDAIKKNFGFKEIKILEKNIGYIRLSEINISGKSLPTLYSAMQFVSNSKALIIDLRDNGGGGSDVGAILPSYFLPKDIVLLEFKSRTNETYTDKTVSWLTEKKYDNPLYIIVNKGTGSAAEAFAFAMQKQNRAKILGQTSAGAAHMNSWYVVNDKLFVSVSTAAPTLPNTEISWERTGVKPDFEIEAGKEIDFIIDSLK